jgi:hypothetical protein
MGEVRCQKAPVRNLAPWSGGGKTSGAGRAHRGIPNCGVHSQGIPAPQATPVEWLAVSVWHCLQGSRQTEWVSRGTAHDSCVGWTLAGLWCLEHQNGQDSVLVCP